MESAEFPVTISPFGSDKKEAAKETKRHIDGSDKQPFSTDGLHLYTGKAGASVAWSQTEWKTW